MQPTTEVCHEEAENADQKGLETLDAHIPSPIVSSSDKEEEETQVVNKRM